VLRVSLVSWGLTGESLQGDTAQRGRYSLFTISVYRLYEKKVRLRKDP
jgi:hypothetical protein